MRKSSGRYTNRGAGPGGWDCPCCAPAPGKRKEHFRLARRRERLDAFKLEYSDVESVNPDLVLPQQG